MSNESIKKIILILIYIIIIIFIALFLDYLFKITIRKRRKQQIKYLAQKKALETGKPLLIFNNQHEGIFQNNNDSTKFTGNILEIINKLDKNSCVVIVSQVLEYVDDVNKLIKQIDKISNGDYYFINLEKNSPRIWWDYKINNVMSKPYYLPSSNDISWNSPNSLQKKIQQFYSIIFKIVPYEPFVKDDIEIIEK